MSKKAEKKDESVLLVEGGENAIGIHLSDSNEHTEMLSKYFADLRKAPVDSTKIYGETLQHLIIQLEFLSRLAGALDFVSRTLEAQMPAGDAKLLAHIEESVEIVENVISEKFTPKL